MSIQRFDPDIDNRGPCDYNVIMDAMPTGDWVLFTDHEADKASAVAEATAALQSRLETAERVVELAMAAKGKYALCVVAEGALNRNRNPETLKAFLGAQNFADAANAALFGALP